MRIIACGRIRRTCWPHCRSGGLVEKAALLEQTKEDALVFAQSVGLITDLFFELGLGLFDGDAAKIGLQHGGMHVALSADGRCVAELRSDGL